MSSGLPRTTGSDKTTSSNTISELLKTPRSETLDSTTQAPLELGVDISVSNEEKPTEKNPQG